MTYQEKVKELEKEIRLYDRALQNIQPRLSKLEDLLDDDPKNAKNADEFSDLDDDQCFYENRRKGFIKELQELKKGGKEAYKG